MGLTHSARLAIGAGLTLAGAIAACSSSKSGGFPTDGTHAVDPNQNQGGDADAGSAPVVSGSSSGGGPTGSFTRNYSDAGNAGAPSSADAACASSQQMGKQQALDAYMMLDYSGSMQMDGKWTGVTTAINSFVAQPTSGISVGLQYFGQPDPDAGTNPFGIPGGDSCDPAVYAKPEIEISPLPAIGAMITQSLANHTMPNTSTPTPPALQGAINHATAWAKAHPADATIAILATDGDPTECGAMGQMETQAQYIAEVEAIAAAGVAATPKILTFVIGVGSSTANLNGIAMAGGTNTAFIVDTSQNITMQFLAALNKIRGAALGCTYKVPIPMIGMTNFNLVNVQFTASGGKPQLVPQCADKAHCPKSGDAWYYDNPSSPANIILCTTTCGTVATGGEVDVLTGCQTVMAPPEK